MIGNVACLENNNVLSRICQEIAKSLSSNFPVNCYPEKVQEVPPIRLHTPLKPSAEREDHLNYEVSDSAQAAGTSAAELSSYTRDNNVVVYRIRLGNQCFNTMKNKK